MICIIDLEMVFGAIYALGLNGRSVTVQVTEPPHAKVYFLMIN